jgi:tripartite-type tricarboxylate transporter receptor subunit TctC
VRLPHRRQFLHLAAGAASLPLLPRPAQAQLYPARPITLIVPFAPGGSTDVTLRALAAATEKHLGQQIIIENRPGGSATIGPAQMAATAQADGYTISQILDSEWRAPFIGKATFDPATDFTYIIGVTGYTYGVVVNSDAPWQTFQDLISAARAKPDTITYATTGGITSPQIAMERIARLKGIKWIPVPFKGNADQINALLGRHIDAIASSTAWAPQVEAGQFRLLVTFPAQRTKSWPAVPTLREVGIDMAVSSPYGIAGPKGMDPGVVKILHDAFKKGMDEPSFVSTMAKLNQEFLYLNSADFRAFALKQIEEERQIAVELGFKRE